MYEKNSTLLYLPFRTVAGRKYKFPVWFALWFCWAALVYCSSGSKHQQEHMRLALSGLPWRCAGLHEVRKLPDCGGPSEPVMCCWTARPQEGSGLGPFLCLGFRSSFPHFHMTCNKSTPHTHSLIFHVYVSGNYRNHVVNVSVSFQSWLVPRCRQPLICC